MKISYDKKIDAMYIRLKSGQYDHTKKITDSILVDISKAGQIMGLEILDASKNVGNIKSEKIQISISQA